MFWAPVTTAEVTSSIRDVEVEMQALSQLGSDVKEIKISLIKDERDGRGNIRPCYVALLLRW